MLIAVLGIGFGFEEEVGILSRDGEIWVGNLTEFRTIWSDDEIPLFKQQGIANVLATVNNYYHGSLTDEDTILDMEAELELHVPRVLFDKDRNTASVRFRNFDRDNLSIFLSSDRSVAATSNCSLFEVIGENQLPIDEITIIADKTESQVQLPTSAAGNSVYYTNPDDDCGPRCAQVSVYQPSYNIDADSYFYECMIEVGKVENAKRDFERVPDETAKVAAAAAALSGVERKNDTVQYQKYAERYVYILSSSVELLSLIQLLPV